jgi:hypothetical protein
MRSNPQIIAGGKQFIPGTKEKISRQLEGVETQPRHKKPLAMLITVATGDFERIQEFSLMDQALTEEDLRRLALLAAAQNFTVTDLEGVCDLRRGIRKISVTIRKEMQERGVGMIAVKDSPEIMLPESGDALLN